MLDCQRMRKEYRRSELDDSDVPDDPRALFDAWFHSAVERGLNEPNAMTLATVGEDGRPSARVVLLKGHDAGGLCFFTNHDSRKGRELRANPFAALVFHWHDLERQVRVEGRVERVDASESDQYFAIRPASARLGAWASEQGRPVANRAELERRLEEMSRRFGDGPIPRPPNWGGFRVVPDRFEFWQGRPSRLHDRIEYILDAGGWTRRRLSP